MKSAGPAIASPGGGAALQLGSQNSRAARISATPITSAIRAITLMELGAGMGLPLCRRRGRSVKQTPAVWRSQAGIAPFVVTGPGKGYRTALVAYQCSPRWQSASGYRNDPSDPK